MPTPQPGHHVLVLIGEGIQRGSGHGAYRKAPLRGGIEHRPEALRSFRR